MMNPIWVVKAYLQLSTLDKLTTAMTATTTTAAVGSRSLLIGGGIIFSTIKQMTHKDSIHGFYKLLSGGNLGVTEGAIQWVLYECLKHLVVHVEGFRGALQERVGMLGSARMAKCVAGLITYPHKVHIVQRPVVVAAI